MSIRDTGACTSTSPRQDAFLLLSAALVQCHEEGTPDTISSLGEGEMDITWTFCVDGLYQKVFVTAWGDGDYSCSAGMEGEVPSCYLDRTTRTDILHLLGEYVAEETKL